MNLFSSEEKEVIDLQLRDATVQYHPNFLSEEQERQYFNKLLEDTPWKEDSVRLFDKTFLQPRLTALYGIEDQPYTYSGLTLQPHPFTKTLLTLKKHIETVCQTTFNTVLLNLYRDGNDSNGWHSDDEKELGKHPFIASLSLGTERKFKLKHKQVPTLKQEVILAPGSLLIMKGTTQEYWKHQIPKSKKIFAPRINLTFRTLQ